MTGSLEEQVRQIYEAGYEGVESALQDSTDPELLRQLLDKYHLGYIALLYTEAPDHLIQFKNFVRQAQDFGAIKVVAHFGRDTMPLADQLRLFESALKIEEEIGIPVAHETHRRRPLFSPMNTFTILQELPTLKINADYSHWCCVTESMLEDHEEVLQLAASRAIHIHTRVGYENGPQVSDPRISEWQRQVQKHQEWWQTIVEQHKIRGENELTFTPEYGPPTYMQTFPGNGEPVANVWDICLWQKKRFEELSALSAKY